MYIFLICPFYTGAIDVYYTGSVPNSAQSTNTGKDDVVVTRGRTTFKLVGNATPKL
jgi:hypothetical protein